MYDLHSDEIIDVYMEYLMSASQESFKKFYDTCYNYYGNDFKFSIDVTDVEPLDESQISRIVNHYINDCSLYSLTEEDISNGKSLKVKWTFQGSNAEETTNTTMNVIYVKYDGWVIADFYSKNFNPKNLE